MLQRLQSTRNLGEALHVGMHDFMSLLGAERGNVQALGQCQDLLIIAQQGLGSSFLEAFRRVSAESTSVCGRAAALGDLVFVPDVTQDEAFGPHLGATRSEGITSILSCPLMTLATGPIGMVSAHFAQRANPTPLEMASAAEYGKALALALDRFLPSEGRIELVEAMASALLESAGTRFDKVSAACERGG